MNRVPVLFIGHGSPMNAVEDNEFTENWKKAGRELPRPKAILAVSAHWYTAGLRVTDVSAPKMVYDMYGFPQELYRLQYPAHGSPELAARVGELVGPGLRTDNTWGLDHGAWSVLRRMYPKADIPVVQLSVDRDASPQEQFALGKKLAPLRGEGVLILGSGNVVHNLSRVDWEMGGMYPWAGEFDRHIRAKITAGDFGAAVDYKAAGDSARLSVPLPDHFYPLLTVLGAADDGDEVSVFNEGGVLGSLSMTCYLFR